ncbi:secreted RxLR effector protein 161-like [Nicotiana tomentosiformis]|uniref:secreted RxLR effector protein 161-like n=1 Tax=Nicotiana tomentosiformis TaxID=4098 RepID=UPI00388C9F15
MIHQQNYVKELLKRFKIEDSKEIGTPIATTMKLNLDEPGSSVDQKIVGLCTRFQENPKESHLKVVKRILRYLKGKIDICQWYPKGSNFDLVGYSDADYAGFLVDKKSTSGMAYFPDSCLVSWATKKQNSMALSTIEENLENRFVLVGSVAGVETIDNWW